MPLGETLTLIATLANALQTFRASRPPDAVHDAAPAIDPMSLMALDLARAANDAALRRREHLIGRLHGLTVLSGAALLASAFLGALSSDAPAAASPLFIASIVMFGVVAAAAIVLNRAVPLTGIGPDDLVIEGAPWPALAAALERARSAERKNHSRLAVLDLAADALLFVVALQIILAAVWLIN